jgi:hypothetical protein
MHKLIKLQVAQLQQLIGLFGGGYHWLTMFISLNSDNHQIKLQEQNHIKEALKQHVNEIESCFLIRPGLFYRMWSLLFSLTCSVRKFVNFIWFTLYMSFAESNLRTELFYLSLPLCPGKKQWHVLVFLLAQNIFINIHCDYYLFTFKEPCILGYAPMLSRA